MAAAVGGASVYTYQAIQEPEIKPVQQEVVSVQPVEKRDTVAVMEPLHQPAPKVEKTIEKPIALKPVEALKPETKILRFRQTELKVVAEILSQTYGVEVRIDDQEVSNCKLTATFANESLETVLMIIQETFNFELQVDGKVQILKGGSCS
jgi:ferric-dicitrate binding protein FerR (iron transport regulator)